MGIEIHCNLIIDTFNKDELPCRYIFKNNQFIFSTITVYVFYNKHEAFFLMWFANVFKREWFRLEGLKLILSRFSYSINAVDYSMNNSVSAPREALCIPLLFYYQKVYFTPSIPCVS